MTFNVGLGVNISGVRGSPETNGIGSEEYILVGVDDSDGM